MFLDAASPSVIDGIEDDNVFLIAIGIVIVVCLISTIIYLKTKKGRKVKNEKV